MIQKKNGRLGAAPSIRFLGERAGRHKGVCPIGIRDICHPESSLGGGDEMIDIGEAFGETVQKDGFPMRCVLSVAQAKHGDVVMIFFTGFVLVMLIQPPIAADTL